MMGVGSGIQIFVGEYRKNEPPSPLNEKIVLRNEKVCIE
jgi:hypothetical protein